MEHLLDGCKAKVARAKELIENLNNEVSTFLNNGGCQVISRHEFERRRYVFRLQSEPLPLRISVLAGEIIHHLRSTLDHLVWAAALKEGLSSDRLKRITFPICATPAKFNEAIKNGNLYGINENLRKFIESLQPYNSADSKNTIVQILHDLDIVEKHRLLVVVTHATRMGQNIKLVGKLTSDVAIIVADTHPDPIPFFRAIEDGVEVHWISYETTTQPLWSIENDFSILAVFQEIGTHKRVEAIPILWQLYKLIEEIFLKIKVSSN